MDNFLGPFALVFKKNKKIKRYIVEIFLIIISVIITIASVLLYLNENKTNEDNASIINIKTDKIITEKIYVDIEGSVNKPDLYRVNPGIRLKEVVDMAGGLSSDADTGFFHRNFNLSSIIFDQEKIYIPSTTEINSDYFAEDKQFLNSSPTSPISDPNSQEPKQKQIKVNVNKATLDELDTLPGVGATTAQKIINGRPFKALLDLINKKAVNKNVYENIKNLIEI